MRGVPVKLSQYLRYSSKVDHRILRRLLARRFRERRLLALFDRLIDAYARVPGKGELQARTGALFACTRIGHDVNWRREVVRFSRLGEAQEPAPCAPWRFLEQQGGQVPLVQPQQEEGR